jgi:hypothetical protein
MSIRRTDYIIKGYILPLELTNMIDGSILDIYDDDFYQNIPEGYEVISTSDDQECIVFGKVLNQIEENDPFYIELNLGSDEDDEEIKNMFNTIFENYIKTDEDPKIYIIKEIA